MTAKETERLARVEEKVSGLADDVQEIKKTLNGINIKFDNLNKSFITVAQAKAVAWLLGFLVAVAVAVVSVVELLKK